LIPHERLSLLVSPPDESFFSAKDPNPPQCFEAAHRSRTGRILPTRRLCVHVPREFCVRSVRRYPGGMLW
jgi:hypothetical protein